MENVTRKEFQELQDKVHDLELTVNELKAENIKMKQASIQQDQQVKPYTQKQQTQKYNKQNYQKPKTEYKKKVSEEVIGKYGLPIAATIMILVGIGVLSFMVWNYIPNIGKAFFILMFALMCMGVGCFFGRDNKMQPFKYSMISLGLAICYTDIVIMNWSWKLINDPVAIVLIMIWCAATAYLSHRYKKKFFYIILEVGLVVTSFIAMNLIEPNFTGLMLMSLTLIMYVISMVGYYVEFKEGSWLFSLSLIGVIWALALSFDWRDEWNVYLLSQRAILLFAIIVAGNFYDYFTESKNNVLKIISSLTMAGALPMFLYIITDYSIYAFDPRLGYETCQFSFDVIGAVLALAYVFIINLKDYSWNTSAVAYIHMVFASAWISEELDCHTIGFIILAIVLYVMSLFKDEKPLKVQFITTDIIALFGFFDIIDYWRGNENVPYTYGIFILALNLFILYRQMTEKKDIYVKLSICTILPAVYGLGARLADDYEKYQASFEIITLILIVLIFQAVFMWRHKFIKPKKDIFTSICSAFVNLVLLNHLDRHSTITLSFVVVLILLHIGFTFYMLIIRESQRFFMDVIFAIISTINFLVIFDYLPLSKYAVLMTLTMILVAAVFISIGFYMKRKGFRLYGLVLIIIGVIKMTMFDISGTNSIIKVLSLIVGGIICLAISFMYNKMEKMLNVSYLENQTDIKDKYENEEDIEENNKTQLMN